MKKILFILSFSLSFNAYGEIVTDEKCGDNCTWSFNTQTGTLTISGTGEMTNWDDYTAVPWSSKIQDIRSLEISKGITNISANAFLGAQSLKSVTIPEGVTTIGLNAFWNSGITQIDLPNTLTTISDSAFNWSPIKQIDIPNSVTFIGDAFRGVPLVDVVIPESVAQIGGRTFSSSLHLQTLTIGENTILGSDIFTYTDGRTNNTDNLKIYCTGNLEKCQKNAGNFSDKVLQASKKQINGVTYVYDNKGKLITTSGKRIEKRIYTIDEANRVAGDKNRVSIRYR